MRYACENVSSDICGQRRPRSNCASTQSDQGLRCSQIESLTTTECFNEEQMPEWGFAHVRDNVNPHISRMLKGTYWLYAAHIIVCIEKLYQLLLYIATSKTLSSVKFCLVKQYIFGLGCNFKIYCNSHSFRIHCTCSCWYFKTAAAFKSCIRKYTSPVANIFYLAVPKLDRHISLRNRSETCLSSLVHTSNCCPKIYKICQWKQRNHNRMKIENPSTRQDLCRGTDIIHILSWLSKSIISSQE